MRATTCEEIEDLIEREALGWSEADRLRVEQHLSECPGCRETLAISRFVRDTLRDAAGGELSDTGRTRAINAALLRGKPAKSLRPGPRRVLGASAALLSAAAAVGLALYLVQPGAELAKTAPQPQLEPSQGPAAPGGTGPAELPREVQQLSAPEAPKPELARANDGDSSAWIETAAPEHHRFAHAEVELAAATRARFDADSHTLELAHGRVDVDVDPARGEPFSVLTQNFRVEVLGTRFSVTPDSVSVTRGRVQVFGHDGGVLARELAPGGSYHYRAPSQGLTQLGTPGLDAARKPSAAQPREPSAPAAAAVREPAAASPSAREPASSAAPVKSAAAWLREARTALARGDGPTTRTLLSSAEASNPTRGERAEATTLRAEAALLERDHAAALRLYREVGERYSDLAAGDNAAFAAAQLAARADKAHERELLEGYLARFPAGRFRDEAKQRLGRLGGQ